MKRILPWLVVSMLVLIVAITQAQESLQRTLTRTEDPVVVKAQAIAPMQGQAVTALAVLRWAEGKFEPIPAQVDERTEAGEFCFDHGPKAAKFVGNGSFDGDDELVFMAADAGDQAPAKAAIPAGAEKAAELLIRDPVSGGQAWAYLMAFAGEPPRSPKDYVSHETKEGRNWVLAENYQFAELIGEAYFDRLMLRGQDGRMSGNLADQIKGRTNIKMMGGLVSARIMDRTTKSDLTAWKDGPVRVLHRMEGYVKGGPLKIGGSGGANNVFYRNFFYTPITIELPFKPSTLFSDFSMYYVIDWNPATEGFRYFDSMNPAGMILDGRMDPEEKNQDYKSPRTYWAVTGPQGNMLVRMTAPEKWAKIVTLQLYYVDDDKVKDDPDNFPGQRQTGYFIYGLYNLDKGKYSYTLYYHAPVGPLDPERVKPILDILNHPLQVQAADWK